MNPNNMVSFRSIRLFAGFCDRISLRNRYSGPTRATRGHCPKIAWVLLLLLTALCQVSTGQDAFEQPPINYSKSKPNGPVARVQQKIKSGEIKFEWERDHGYLKSLLKAFDIDPRSQLLIYSKTSLQLHKITPRTPRAIYFNDDVYIGFIPGSDRLEVSEADPQLGGVFYTMRQDNPKPVFLRDSGNCLGCHATSRTQYVPGHLMRSVYAAPSGQPHYGMGTYLTTQESPFEERFGGWYVTGEHGTIRHMGNLILQNKNDRVDRDQGANVTDLGSRTRTERYLTPHSDLVALMTLAHQAEMHNLITLANFRTRQAIHQGKVMNKALDRPEDYISDSTQSRIRNACEKLVRYMLFVDEAPLESPIRGTSGFQEYFESRGPFDKRGRSLRQFDLRTRTFKYPCSYLIHSEAFQKLPIAAKTRIYERLWEILTGEEKSDDFDHLSDTDRLAIRNILADTIPDLPDYWKPAQEGTPTN